MHLLSELIDDTVNPVEFLCSTLKSDNLETLDLILSEKFTNWKTKFPLSAAEDGQNENPNVFRKYLYVYIFKELFMNKHNANTL